MHVVAAIPEFELLPGSDTLRVFRFDCCAGIVLSAVRSASTIENFDDITRMFIRSEFKSDLSGPTHIEKGTQHRQVVVAAKKPASSFGSDGWFPLLHRLR